MNIFKKLLILVAIVTAFSNATASLAASSDPLFVNMTTNDPHRAEMAITFGKAQFERGHPLTIFLNDKGVLVGSKSESVMFEKHQKVLNDLVDKGAKIISCPMCMKHYGVKVEDLIEGIQVGNPDLTGEALFQENTRTLTW